MRSLLIGDNPFLGVSHYSQVRAREKLEYLRLQTVLRVIERAIRCGATGFTFSVHPVNLEILSALRDAGTLDQEFELFPILPYAAGYVRVLNERGMSGLLREELSKLSLPNKAKTLLKSSLSAVTLDPVRMMNAYIDVQLASIPGLKRANLKAVLLHEVVTDLALSFRANHLFDSYARHIRNKYGVMPGFVTRNLARFAEFFAESHLSLEHTTIMTPVNGIGFQMNPSRDSCEASLSRLRESYVIAMSIMAGGYLRLDQAIDYLRTLSSLSGVAVGVSSEEHAEQTFAGLRSLIKASPAA